MLGHYPEGKKKAVVLEYYHEAHVKRYIGIIHELFLISLLYIRNEEARSV